MGPQSKWSRRKRKGRQNGKRSCYRREITNSKKWTNLTHVKRQITASANIHILSTLGDAAGPCTSDEEEEEYVRWQRIILCARGILDDSSACEYWATKVAMDGPPVQLRRAIEKLVTFYRHIFTLIKFASSPRMRPTSFSTEITVTSVEKKRPDLLKWPSKESEWMDLLSTIYMKQDLELETGQKAKSSEQKVGKRATEYRRLATIHCKCAVVAYLHQRGSYPAFFYIGEVPSGRSQECSKTSSSSTSGPQSTLASPLTTR
ncbi:hypothetical protein MMC31_003647 [Peltigera leucophlebia]|nr:hypothetical protein [Peltigera leucophlebia]